MSTITTAIDPTINGTLTTSTIWTDTTTTSTKPTLWIHRDSGDMYIPATKGTVTLNAQARVNKTTLQEKEMPAILAMVKHKLLKQLFEQLEATAAVKITSVKSPTTASITFHASLELVPPRDDKA